MCLSDARLDGKVAIVTGANTGIGLETVADLVARGRECISQSKTLFSASLGNETNSEPARMQVANSKTVCNVL